MPTQPLNNKSRRKPGYLIILALCTIAFIVVILQRSPTKKEPLLPFREKEQTYSIHEGTLGERKKISLPGGATITLNSNTRLLVPADFSSSHTLLLDGEAYFDSTIYPLTVKTNILTMTVTAPASFKVRCFEAQQGATAYVYSGEVKVSKSYHSKTDNQPEILGPGNMVLANKEIDLMEKETYQPAEMTAWLEGKLSFQDEPFMNAVRKLEEWYSTEIYVTGNVAAAGSINSEFNRATLTDVLEQLSQSAKFTYKIKKNKVMIDF